MHQLGPILTSLALDDARRAFLAKIIHPSYPCLIMYNSGVSAGMLNSLILLILITCLKTFGITLLICKRLL
jgi:hypothetical protein